MEEKTKTRCGNVRHNTRPLSQYIVNMMLQRVNPEMKAKYYLLRLYFHMKTSLTQNKIIMNQTPLIFELV